jgi:hypothetical protein
MSVILTFFAARTSNLMQLPFCLKSVQPLRKRFHICLYIYIYIYDFIEQGRKKIPTLLCPRTTDMTLSPNKTRNAHIIFMENDGHRSLSNCEIGYGYLATNSHTEPNPESWYWAWANSEPHKRMPFQDGHRFARNAATWVQGHKQLTVVGSVASRRLKLHSHI